MARPSFFPSTPDQFISELERRAPEPRPSPADCIERVMFDAGRRALALEMRDFLASTQKEPPSVHRQDTRQDRG